jgi:hypothetical protein
MTGNHGRQPSGKADEPPYRFLKPVFLEIRTGPVGWCDFGELGNGGSA